MPNERYGAAIALAEKELDSWGTVSETVDGVSGVAVFLAGGQTALLGLLEELYAARDAQCPLTGLRDGERHPDE